VESIKGKVAIIGVGIIPFGEWHEKSLEDMAQEAFINCVKSVDKGIDPKEMEAAWVGSIGMDLLFPGVLSGSWLATQIGNCEIPITRVGVGDPTGSDTLRHAALGIASGLYDVTLALGAEKMREQPDSHYLTLLSSTPIGGSPGWTYGLTVPALQALYATKQMHEFGYTMEMFARVAVKNHRNGKLCPYAFYRE
jgi:acetyl-CoA C-acetyltransferase